MEKSQEPREADKSLVWKGKREEKDPPQPLLTCDHDFLLAFILLLTIV
jgi:hypothetical protein